MHLSIRFLSFPSESKFRRNYILIESYNSDNSGMLCVESSM